jgi:superoxide reductase
MPIRIQQGPGAQPAATDPDATAPDALHTPFIHCVERTRAGEPFPVAVRVGHDVEHPDEPEHHIAWLQLWSGDQLLAEARFAPGLLGGEGHPMVTFNLVPATGVLELTALAYCSRHGLWQGPSRRVDVDAPTDDEE